MLDQRISILSQFSFTTIQRRHRLSLSLRKLSVAAADSRLALPPSPAPRSYLCRISLNLSLLHSFSTSVTGGRHTLPQPTSPFIFTYCHRQNTTPLPPRSRRSRSCCCSRRKPPPLTGILSQSLLSSSPFSPASSRSAPISSSLLNLSQILFLCTLSLLSNPQPNPHGIFLSSISIQKVTVIPISVSHLTFKTEIPKTELTQILILSQPLSRPP